MSDSALSLAPARRIPGVIPALVAVFLVAAEAYSAWQALRSHGLLTARPARVDVAIYAAMVTCVAILALVGGWARRLAIIGPALLAAGVLGATAILGGQAGSMVAATLSMSASWFVGQRLLRLIGAGALAERVVVAWLSGLGPLCLLTLLLGRLSLLRWWTIDLVVIVLGGLGVAQGLRLLWARRRLIAGEVGSSSAGAASAGVILLTVAVAAIYTAAPEIQYDPLYAKAYLPMLWAHTGAIGALTQHVQLNIAGWFQMIATWGNLLGAPATGRYLQLFAYCAAPAVVWSWTRRSGSLGPLAAVAVAITPTLFWQATTADDDLLLGLSAFALAVAVFESLQPNFRSSDRAAGVALGLMAGTCASLKTFLIPLAAILLLGWIVQGRRWRTAALRALFAVAGAVVTAGPPLVLRWIDTGNPLFPAYNNVFKSPYWPPVNEKLNFPFWPHPGAWAPIKAIWEAMFHPVLMQEAAAPGAFGFLIGILVVALVIGWRYRRRIRGSFVLWIAILLATAAWWIEFRYLRYLLPEAFAAVALLAVVVGRIELPIPRPAATVAAIAVAGVASFTVAVAQLWNVPNKKPPVSAALAHWKAASYLQAALPERETILAFNRLAPPRAAMVSDAFERAWLTRGRDLYAPWELAILLQLHGPLPRSGDAAFARLRAMGVDWALINGRDESLAADPWLQQLLRTHAQPLFGAAGYALYELVERPSTPTPVTGCDRGPSALSGCWAVAHGPGGVATYVRHIMVCPGQLLAVVVTQTPGGQPAPVDLNFPGASSGQTFAPGQTVPGSTQTVYATVPAGVQHADVNIGPIAGSRVTQARVERFAATCTSA